MVDADKDLVERLRSYWVYRQNQIAARQVMEQAAARIEAMADEIEALRKGVEAIANGDVPRPIGKRYRSDLEPSKHDRCVHDKWMYEDCGNCIEAFATALLKGTPNGQV